MSTRSEIAARISETIDADYGSDTETTLRYHELKDAIEVRVYTTIEGKRHDFWYFYPLWWVQDHQLYRQEADEFDVDNMIDEVTGMAARELVWSYHAKPQSGLVSAYKQIVGEQWAI